MLQRQTQGRCVRLLLFVGELVAGPSDNLWRRCLCHPISRILPSSAFCVNTYAVQACPRLHLLTQGYATDEGKLFRGGKYTLALGKEVLIVSAPDTQL